MVSIQPIPGKILTLPLIPVVEELTDQIIAAGGSAGSSLGTGGMYTEKSAAARIAGNQKATPRSSIHWPDHPAHLRSLSGRATVREPFFCPKSIN